MRGFYYLARWIAVIFIAALALSGGHHHGWVALVLAALLGCGVSGGFLHRNRA